MHCAQLVDFRQSDIDRRFGISLHNAPGPGLMLCMDCHRPFPDHDQCPPEPCTNAEKECKPIEFDLFQAMHHSSVDQD